MTIRTQTVQFNLLPFNHITWLQPLNNRNSDIFEALSMAAFFARKVRMAAHFTAITGQLIIPGPLAKIRLMHQSYLDK